MISVNLVVECLPLVHTKQTSVRVTEIQTMWVSVRVIDKQPPSYCAQDSYYTDWQLIEKQQ